MSSPPRSASPKRAPKGPAQPGPSAASGVRPDRGEAKGGKAPTARNPSPPKPRARSPTRVRPLSPEEIAREKEAAKQAYLERRRAVEDEFVVLQKDHDHLVAEVDRINSAGGDGGPIEGGAEAFLAKKQKESEGLDAQVAEATQRCERAARRKQDVVSRQQTQEAMLNGEHKALREELDRLRGQCAEQEDRAQQLLAEIEETRELLQRGADELQQLRNELWERQGEKALLVADQTSAARLGAEQRAQAVSAEAQVTQLAQALDCEDSRLAREQRRLRRVEAEQCGRAQGERREWELASSTLPERIQQERGETGRCKKAAEDWRIDLQAAQDSLAKAREQYNNRAELVRAKTAEVWRAEGERDAARVARQAVEAEAKRAEAEAAQLAAWAERMKDQNRQLALHNVKTRNAASALEQDNIRRQVEEFIKADPDSSLPGSSKAAMQLEARAARLGLAGIGGSTPPVVGLAGRA